jgi:hypothetical protein
VGGVNDDIRPRFWAWVCGAGGRGVPKWRLDSVGNDAEVTIGGMLCDQQHYDMLKAFAEAESRSKPTWSNDIDQDVS